MNALNRFFFEIDADSFFKRAIPLLYLSGIYFFWQHDWTPYIQMSQYLFSPQGLLSFLGLSYPSASTILILQLTGSISCLLTIFVKKVRPISSFLVFFLLLILDFFSNGFGFINVQIHLIWFFLVFALVLSFESLRWFKAFAFRMLELIVVLAYLQSFLSKMIIAGSAWGIDGTVLQIGILRQGLPYGLFIVQSNLLSKFLCSGALIFEAAFALYFFLPPKLKKVFLGTGILFHISTFVFLGIGFYHLWVMNACIILFAYREVSNGPSLATTTYEL